MVQENTQIIFAWSSPGGYSQSNDTAMRELWTEIVQAPELSQVEAAKDQRVHLMTTEIAAGRIDGLWASHIWPNGFIQRGSRIWTQRPYTENTWRDFRGWNMGCLYIHSPVGNDVQERWVASPGNPSGPLFQPQPRAPKYWTALRGNSIIIRYRKCSLYLLSLWAPPPAPCQWYS